MLDGAGRPQYLLGISHDITERKQVVAELSVAKSAAAARDRWIQPGAGQGATLNFTLTEPHA
jgi:hypothetical protein